MKSLIVALMLLCVVVVGGTIFYLNQHNAPSAPVSLSEASAAQTPLLKTAVPKPEPQPAIFQSTNEPAQMQVAIPAASETKANDSTNAIGKLVDTLLTANNAGQKHALFEQLRHSGQLNELITELQQRMTQNPNNPEIPTTLGEAQLNQSRAIREAGGDLNEMAILAMQADQNFNAALKLDPTSWEAQFVKNLSLSYWPAEPARDSGVVQSLSSLIDQQDAMPAQPEFAQTYLVLGNEYQKIGQLDKAAATWQLGRTKFPNDPTLQKKISGQ